MTRSIWSAQSHPLLVSVGFPEGPWSTADEISVAVAQTAFGVPALKMGITSEKRQGCHAELLSILQRQHWAKSDMQAEELSRFMGAANGTKMHLFTYLAFLQRPLAGLCWSQVLAHTQSLSPAPLAHTLLTSHAKYSYFDALLGFSSPRTLEVSFIVS